MESGLPVRSFMTFNPVGIQCGYSLTTVLSVQSVNGGVKSQFITHRPESADHAFGDVGKIRMMAEGFTLMNIGQMNLNKRDVNR